MTNSNTSSTWGCQVKSVHPVGHVTMRRVAQAAPTAPVNHQTTARQRTKIGEWSASSRPPRYLSS